MASWQVVQTQTIRTFPAELMAPETIKAQLYPNSCFIGKYHGRLCGYIGLTVTIHTKYKNILCIDVNIV